MHASTTPAQTHRYPDSPLPEHCSTRSCQTSTVVAPTRSPSLVYALLVGFEANGPDADLSASGDAVGGDRGSRQGRAPHCGGILGGGRRWHTSHPKSRYHDHLFACSWLHHGAWTGISRRQPELLAEHAYTSAEIGKRVGDGVVVRRRYLSCQPRGLRSVAPPGPGRVRAVASATRARMLIFWFGSHGMSSALTTKMWVGTL